MTTFKSRMSVVPFTFILTYCLIGSLSFISITPANAAGEGTQESTYFNTSGKFSATQLFKVDTGGGILPLHNFTLAVTLKENTVFLKWVAENEMNTEKFVIQRSADGTTFKNISVIAPTGSNNILTEYNSSDDVAGVTSTVAYYRIKAEDNRGNFAFSNVVPVRLAKADGFSFWPNPFSANLNLTYNATISAAIRVELYDNGGRLVLQQQFNVNRGMNQLSVNGASGLSHGIYHARIIDLMTNAVSFAKMAK